MKRTMVTFTVKAGRGEENEALIRKVFDGLRTLNDPGVHDGSFKLEDGRTFVHLASFEQPEEQALLSDSPAFKAFQKDLKDRCEVPPSARPLTPVDGFGFH